MAFFDSFIKRFRGDAARADPAAAPAPSEPAEDPILTALIYGHEITRGMALNIPAVSSSVRKITDTVSMVPFCLYKKSKTGDNKVSVEEVKDDYRLKLINDDPGDTLDAAQFKKALVKDYLLGRGGYAYIRHSSGVLIHSLHYVPECLLSFYCNDDPLDKTYSTFLNRERYSEYEFLKILRSTANGYCGVGILREINKALESAYSALIYQLKLTKTGGAKKGFILSEKQRDEKAIKALKDAWRRMYSDDTESIVVLNNGLKFQEAAQTPMDMQLASIRLNLNKDIREAFGIEEKNENFVLYTITPILTAIEKALNRYLLLETEKDYYFWKADTRVIDKTAGDRASKVMTINEQRYHEGLPEVDGLDIIPQPLGNTFFDTKRGQFYTPNTGQTGSASSSKGGEN